MEDWHDYAFALGVASAVALTASVAIYAALRLLHVNPRLRKQHTWRTDLRPIRWIGPVLFVLVLLPVVFVTSLFSDMCGTGNPLEFMSPDRNHKIVVYSFDCGATTDFSLIVSLLGANDHLPKHNPASVLYSHYHQEPTRSNVQVIWDGSHRALVKVEGFDGTPLVTQDGVSVRFERLRLDLPPFLRQPVKTQNSSKGERSHGVVEKDVHEEVQAGGGAAAGTREFDGRGIAGVGGESQRAAPLASWDSAGAGQRVSGHGKQRWAEGRIAELERKIGQQDWESIILKGCLQRIEEQRVLQALSGNPPSTKGCKK